MKEELEKEISAILESFGVKDLKVSFDYPTRIDFGDLSTNAAMAYAKELGKKPLDLANEIKNKLFHTACGKVMRIEVVGGFINFFFNKEYFAEKVKEILDKGPSFAKSYGLAKQKIIIEYTVTNVLKPMHIGHLMGNVIGESLSRIFEYSGAEIKRNNYQGDSGLHVAKAVWGIMKLGGIIDGNLSEKTNYIGNSYVLGTNSYEDDPKSAEEIKEINKKLFEKSDKELVVLYEWGRKISLDHFEELYKKLGTKFDFYFFESEVADDALRIVREFIKKGVFEESEGAVVFHGEKYDPKLHTRVFINSQGIPMYEAKDIAHAIRKYDQYKFDKSIIITANEQNEYFKVVLRALQEIRSDIAEKTQHLSHGLLKLPSGKMSSRKGNTITGEELIGQVEKKVLEKMNSREDMSRTVLDMENVAEIVAIGAIKYSILRQAIGGDIIFDFEKSISFEGDSGPYLQYACVRAKSVLQKAEKLDLGVRLPSGWETTNLERLLERFPSVVERAGGEYAPHYIVTYLIELAGEFNSFYTSHKIIDQSDPTSPYRLALTQAFVFVMTSGLDLLGIKVPEKM
ncbi:MAG TPA: arginine--tRNA ligase [Candidatus Paceibacterota bacterium]